MYKASGGPRQRLGVTQGAWFCDKPPLRQVCQKYAMPWPREREGAEGAPAPSYAGLPGLAEGRSELKICGPSWPRVVRSCAGQLRLLQQRLALGFILFVHVVFTSVVHAVATYFFGDFRLQRPVLSHPLPCVWWQRQLSVFTYPRGSICSTVMELA